MGERISAEEKRERWLMEEKEKEKKNRRKRSEEWQNEIDKKRNLEEIKKNGGREERWRKEGKM